MSFGELEVPCCNEHPAGLEPLGVQILEEQLERRGEALSSLHGVLLRTVADVQHRLTFRAQAFIKVPVYILSLTLVGSTNIGYNPCRVSQPIHSCALFVK